MILLLSTALAQELPLDDLDAPEAPAPLDGRPLLLAYGVAAGGLQAGSLGYVFNQEVGAGPVMLGGLGGGLLTARLTAERSTTLDQAMVISTAGLLGAWTGYEAGLAIIPPGAEREHARIAAAGQLGNLAGTGLGLLIQNVDLPASTTGDMVLAGTAGWQLGAGIGDLAGLTTPDTRQARAGLQLGTGYGLAAADLALHQAGMAPPAPSTLFVTTAQGAWIGGWTPRLFLETVEERHTRGGVRVGAAAGYAGSVALSQRDVEPVRDLYSLTWFSVGSLLGSGLGGVASPSGTPSQWVGPMLGAGVAGHLVGELTWDQVHVTGEEGAGIVLLSGWALAQSAGWGGWYRGEEQFGGALALAVAGGHEAVALAVPAYGELPADEMAVALSLGLWSGWLGGFAASLVPEQALEPPTLIAADVGLAAGLVASQAGWDPGWAQVAAVNGLAATGATIGSLVGIAVDGTEHSLRVGNVAGTAAGLTAGVAVAAMLPQASPRSASLAPRLPRVQRLGVRFAFTATPWTGEDGSQGAYLALSGYEGD